MPDEPTPIIVDTNCYVRLYFHQRLRPLLGAVVGEYRLVTLKELAGEPSKGTGLADRHTWISAPEIQAEIHEAVLPLTDEERQEYREWAGRYRIAGDKILRAHCEARRIQLRSLSLNDATAMTIAVDRGYALATDDWPLRLVCSKFDAEDGQGPKLFTSLEVLQLLEAATKISAEERISVVRDWMRHGEWVEAWRDDYRRLFSVAPPTVQ